MVDQVAHSSASRIPLPKSLPSPNVRNGKCGTDVVVPILLGESDGSIGETNGNTSHSQTKDLKPKQNVPKANVPKDLLLETTKVKDKKLHAEKGFETFLMTGDMIIKTNPSLKLRRLDGSGLERHHSDSSAPSDSLSEKRMFKRSASSPDQTTFTGANLSKEIHDALSPKSADGDSKEGDDETLIDRKASAESGFEEQIVHSDSGTLEKNRRLPNDPTSVSDLSEFDSDDLLGNMVESQTSVLSNNISAVSTPSDLRSDISVNTVLQQEVEPLLNEDSSSSSLEISSGESDSGELTPEMIFERSMSDSGGMSPVTNHSVSKSLLSCKSAEKIIQRQNRATSQDTQLVRASKSQENYFADDFTFVSIDIDDTAYSLDQIPRDVERTPTKEDAPFPVFSPETVSSRSRDIKMDNSEKVFMPGFIKLDKSDVRNSESDMDSELKGLQGESCDNSYMETYDDDTDGDKSEIQEEDASGDDPNIFALPPAKSVDHPSAKRLAKRLFNLDGFRKSDVSRHLSKKNDFSTLVAEEYLKFFDFSGETLDVALRKFLKQFSLIGETQERERVLAHFSRHYIQSNQASYNSEDACHTLVCAIMLLNTDLHGQAVGRKMTCSEFIENLSELNDGENFPKDVLKALYQAIKAEPIEWAPDEEFQDQDANNCDQKGAPPAPNLPNLPPAIGKNPFLDIPDPSKTLEYKKGYIMRKCCVDPDGRKTPVGKRGWKMFYVVLKDMILYLYKDEQGMKKSGSSSDGSPNAIRVHHCLASKASDYTKKQHVLRLQTACWAEYLFQTSNTKELQEWIDTLNYVAASLSAPPLPGAVGSNKKFQRPLLPVSYTLLNMQDQLRHWESRLEETERDLLEHRTYPPEKGSKASAIQHFLEKENYLVFEVDRLKTYIYLLQAKLSSQPELEPSLVETCIGEDEEGYSGLGAPDSSLSPGGKKGGVVPRSITDRCRRVDYIPTLSTLV